MTYSSYLGQLFCGFYADWKIEYYSNGLADGLVSYIGVGDKVHFQHKWMLNLDSGCNSDYRGKFLYYLTE